jgi:hypothetical protein
MRLVQNLRVTGPNQVLFRRGPEHSDVLFDLLRDEISFTDSVFHYRPLDGEMNDIIDGFFKDVDGTRFSEWTPEQKQTLQLLLSWDYYDPTHAVDKGFLPSANFMMGRCYYKKEVTESQLAILNKLQTAGIDWGRLEGEVASVLAARAGALITAPALTNFSRTSVGLLLQRIQLQNAASFTLPGVELTGLAGVISEIAGSAAMGAGLSMYGMQASMAAADDHRTGGQPSSFTEPPGGGGVPIDRRLVDLDPAFEIEPTEPLEEEVGSELSIVKFGDDGDVFPERERDMETLEVGHYVYVHSLGKAYEILDRKIVREKVHYTINVPLKQSWTRWFAEMSTIGVNQNVMVPASDLHPSNTWGIVILNSLPWDWWGIAQTTMETVVMGLLSYGAESYLGFSGLHFITLAERMTSGAMSTRWITMGNRLSYAFRKVPRTAALVGGFKRHGLVQLSPNMAIVSQTYSFQWLTSAYGLWQLYSRVSPRDLAITMSSTLEGDPFSMQEVSAEALELVSDAVEATVDATVNVAVAAKDSITGIINTGVGALLITVGTLVGLRVYNSFK